MVIKNKRLTHFALPIRDLLHLNEFQVKINYPYLAWKRDSNFQFSSLTTELFTNIINQKKTKTYVALDKLYLDDSRLSSPSSDHEAESLDEVLMYCRGSNY